MVRVQETFDRLSTWGELYCNHVTPPDWWPGLTIVACVAALAGLVLAFWGARILRTLYVLALMGAGAAIGVRIARGINVDDLIGLVFGAGILGLIGHLCYRWWVAVSAGACALLLAAVLAGPEIVPRLSDEGNLLVGLRVADPRAAAAAAEYWLPDPRSYNADGQAWSWRYVSIVAADLWGTAPDRIRHLSLLLGAAGLLGLIFGLVLPRLTTIVVTSLVGVAALLIGLGLLVSTRSQGVWAFVDAHVGWFLAGAGILLAVSLAYQARHGRRPPVPVVPAPAA